jgi:hypothetical protein
VTSNVCNIEDRGTPAPREDLKAEERELKHVYAL